jgi:hypothetical protein
MNERIKELAEQCWDKRPEGQLHFDNEKFAELIVRECVAIANRQFSAATGLDDRDCLTAQQMKQLFGVKE